MNGLERTLKILNHEKTDRIGVYEHFWGDTINDWRNKGFVGENEYFENHFDLDMQYCWAFELVANLDFVPEVISENESTITMLDGNGATLKKSKLHNATPEHIDFKVKSREEWDKIKHFLTVDDRRINFKDYREKKENCRKTGKYFGWCGVNVFESMHPVCGHEYMLMGMLDDPEWISDMVLTYAKLTVDLQKRLFEVEGYPDGIFYYEDMGYKNAPFMSPDLYKEIIMPGHVYTIDYAHSIGRKVIMHSCGFVEPLLPFMVEAGIDALHAIEVKAGMDLIRIQEKYKDKIALIGGIDVRCLYNNDKDEIDRELNSKIPFLKNGFNYIAHSDHSIPVNVTYETYKYFLGRILELGKIN